MDIVSYAKASNSINKIKQTKKELGPNVKKDFSSLDERLDYLEGQLEGRYIETDIQAILEAGVFNNTEIVDGELKLKKIRTENTVNKDIYNITPTSITDQRITVCEQTTPSTIPDVYDYGVARLFDKVIGTDKGRYAGESLTLGPNIITFNNKTPFVLEYYGLNCSVNPEANPKKWKVYGSNNKFDWEFLGEYVNYDHINKMTLFELHKKKAFLYHKFEFTENINLTRFGVSIDEMTLYASGLSEEMKPFYQKENRDVLELQTKGLIPKMTSNTSPSGIAQASSIYSSVYDAFKAFDKIDNSEGWVTSFSLTGWLSYEFPMIQSINEYTMKSPNNTSSSYKEMAKDWTLEGFDGVNWIVLDEQMNQIFGVNEEKRYKLKNTAKFKKYRINVTANNGFGSYTGIQELQFYLKEQAIYASNGTWESGVIDLNDSFIELKAVLFDEIVSNEHFIKKEIAYSNDGILFSDYEIINNDTLRNEQFIKIRITLTSNDYTETEEEIFFNEEGNVLFKSNSDFINQSTKLETKTTISKSAIQDTFFYEIDITDINKKEILAIKEVY